MNKVLAIVLFVAVAAAQAKVIPEMVDRIALFPEILKTLGLENKVSATSNKIVNGAVVEPNSVPWQVAIKIDLATGCGGSIISPNWILTAAHCCARANRMNILAGAHNLLDDNEATRFTVVNATDIRVHPEWNRLRVQNDVCVVRLETALPDTPAIKRICLAQPSINLRVGQILTVTGWGQTSDNSGVATLLHTANVAYADNSVCNATYNGIIVDTHLCVSSLNGTSPCNGDSGGPLTEQQGLGQPVRQVGVVSFGSNTCEASLPAGFARVSSYYEWIVNNVTKIDTTGCN